MRMLEVGRTIGVAANVGVVIGIVFLAIEVNQNQQALEEQNFLNRAEIRRESGDAFNGWRAMLLENPDLIPIWDKGQSDQELTAAEAAQFSRLCSYRVWMQINLLVQMDLLGFTQEFEGSARNLSNEISESRAVRACWNAAKEGARSRGHEDIVSRVDSLVSVQ